MFTNKNLFSNACKLVLCTVLLSSCEKNSTNYKKENSENYTIGAYQVTVIDSCEYVVVNYDRSRSVTHKGNCKFCTQRNSK